MAEKTKGTKRPKRKVKRASRSTKKRKSSNQPGRRKSSFLRSFLLKAGVLAIVLAGFYVLYLDSYIRYEFQGKRWAVPAHVFARPLELYPGAVLTPQQLERELKLLGYRSNLSGARAGSYQRSGSEIRIITRPFVFWDGPEEQLFIRVSFNKDVVTGIKDLNGKSELSLVRLDPYRYATIFPSHHEDRMLVKRDELPDSFVKGLLAVEDRNFFEHHGIDFRGLARALWVNISTMKLAQGGSTLTQQLVKNFFLTHERTLSRKAKEAVMASLLELHYEKDDILEAYVNEVYLGQDGKRAIHGFGLGAQFYFGADLHDLPVADLALLVGMVKGPSYYNPRRFPERALKRRNQVLRIMADQGVITSGEAQQAIRTPLNVSPKGGGVSRFPAFVELVREQLSRDYREEDLQSEGLQIFTTLDPLVQMASEEAVERQLSRLEKRKGVDALQSAAVVTNTGSGEVLAMVGDRVATSAGFNRAMSAKRQVGSLIKPAVYLAALQEHQYTLISPIDDAPLSLPMGGNETWEPQNFDQTFAGQIPLYQGLVESKNVATVRLGLDVGVKSVIHMLHTLGIEDELPPFPSLMLGAVELTPMAITQMYQTLADGGFYTPLRAIRTVIDQDRNVLQRFPLEVNQVVDASSTYLINHTLQLAVQDGTGQSLANMIKPSYNIAGKTGTSNDGRDSWFAGFTGNRLGVVWVGRDDSKATALTGAQGAMRVWGDLMMNEGLMPLELPQPSNVEMVWIDSANNRRSNALCSTAIKIPFLEGSAPKVSGKCGQPADASSGNWLKNIFSN